MRWESLRIDDGTVGASGRDGALGSEVTPALLERGAVSRTFDTPSFKGMTFFEVHSHSVLNRVPAASRMPFRWTVNPYRGCSHACVYCFARQTHTYLDLDAGLDFDSKVVVKVNAAEVLRRELAAPRWTREHVAMGTNVDPYQRVEGRYALMPGIIAALTGAGTPFSVLTKGSLVLRDLDLFRAAAEVVDVGVSVSVGSVDPALWRAVEPGTPSPRARLDVVRAFTRAGIGCGVLMAPVLPFLSDSDEQLEATVRAIAESGASSLTALALHLRPGARQWWFTWLRAHRPELVEPYERLYAGRAYAPAAYQRDLAERVRTLAARHQVDRDMPRSSPWRSAGAPRAAAAMPVVPPEGEPPRAPFAAEQLALTL